MRDEILSFISIAAKAGKIASGEYAAGKAIKDKKAELVIIANDASCNSKKKFSDMCAYRDIEYRFYAEMVSLGKACGKDERAGIAICDAGFAQKLIKLLNYTEVEI